ncbi:FYVE, RhoGEF and PH domain-containing protein 6 isoform X1 [Triplophysa rosa]|nr:FYVE, RhoGEF and PH domain-containing protein 6 isoform X1 [Triplophysa rosa]
MSTGMKKPPVAPKPKLGHPQKPSPPPIAPKPEILQPSPSPSLLKRGKPAVAPKPCLPKVNPVVPQKPPQLRQDPCKTQHPPVSKNGGPALLHSHLSHYIIPPCPQGHLPGDSRLEGSKEISGTPELGVFKEDENPKEQLCHDTREQADLSEVQIQAPTDSHTSTETQEETHTPTLVKNLACAQLQTPQVPKHSHAQPLQEQDESLESKQTGIFVVDFCTSESVGVPAPPSKPLPVPHPRRSRRALYRQNIVETEPVESQTDTPTETSEHIQLDTVLENPQSTSTTCHTHMDPPLNSHFSKENTENTECSRSTDPLHKIHSSHVAQTKDTPPQINSVHYSVPTNGATLTLVNKSAEEESQPPAPPPRQKSLPHTGDSSYKTSSSVDSLLFHCHSDSHGSVDKEEDEELQNNDEDDEAYGDFARYPITRSLPKQIKLSCGQQVSMAITKIFNGDERSPKVTPKKPQRNSLPASSVLRKQNTPSQTDTPPPLPNSSPPVFKELPAPPQEKPSWRVALPSIPLFSRNQPSRSNSQPQAEGVKSVSTIKQRAKSFSSADLQRADTSEQLVRSEQGRRSLRKLIELRVCARLLPKLLRSGQSLDCTRADAENHRDAENHSDTPTNQVAPGNEEAVQGDSEGDCGVEYENLPLYAEIPEYMNLPWVYSNQDVDASVYEVQEPCEINRLSGDLSEDGLSSNDEDDNSSNSSKEDLSQSKDKEEIERSKRNKVVHIAMEIMSSEKVFVDVLKLLHIDFRDAVAKATRASGKPLVEEKVLNQILYYLPQLYELNKDLLKELEERVAHWSDHQRLADIFVQKGPYLKMYSTYIREFDRNVALLDEQCRKNPPFASIVRQFEMSPRCAHLALKHYLLKPVQRIPQYQLLLTDYLKNLPEDSSDYKDTQTALSVVKEVANHANDIMKQGDNFEKLMQVQYSLNGHHEIVQPGRVFLKEGTLMKLSRKVMQPRMFFLFNDILLYTTPVQSGQYKVNSMLSLAGMKVSKPSQEAYQNELNIESVERSFILSANSATERDEWLEAIAKAIDDYTRKKISFFSSRSQELEGFSDDGPPLGSKAPIWIPDLRTTMCMICTCEFTLTWRRHHCRACGRVVCQACSSNKYYLEYLKNQLARVCDHCYIKLQHKGDQSNVTVSPSGRSSTFAFSRKQKKIPSALKEVSANTENSSMSGYLQRSKGQKKPWKRLWFVIKNKVLYTYAASEDVAALESQPLLGFFLREEKTGPAQKLQFKLYHKNTLYYIFRAEDIPTAQRWIEAFQEAMIL